MVVTKENIIVTVKGNTKAFEQSMLRAGKSLRNVQGNLNGVQAVAGLSQEQFRRVGGSLHTANNAGVRFGGRLRMMTAGLRGFRMEMLGVMFFGMAMANMFGAMLKPAANLFGVFDLWGNTMQVVMLPVMTLIAPLLNKFMIFMIGLPKPVQFVIGAVTLLGFVIGKLLLYIGTITLGLGALWGTSIPATLGILAAKAAAVFGAISLGMVALVGGIIAAVVLLVVAWNKNWFGIQEKTKGFLTGLLDSFKDVFTKIKDGWTSMWASMINPVIRMYNKLAEKVPFLGTINEIDTSSASSQVKSPNFTPITQEIQIQTNTSEENVRLAIAEANTDLLRELRRNTV